MTLNFNAVIRFFFLTTLFLYPFTFFEHTLFLIPQAGLIIAILLHRLMRNERHEVTLLTVFITLFTLYVCFTPLLFRQFHENSSFFFVIKIFLNFSTILAIVLCKQNLIYEDDIAILRKFRNVFLMISLLTYCFLSSYLEIGAVLVVFFKNPDSSKLYVLAEPLSHIFITKNITAMFMVSLFSYDLFLSTFFNKKVSTKTWILYGLLITIFFSRQAILAYCILAAAYYLFYAPLIKRMTGLAIIGCCGFLFFITFFNLASKNDGGNQRMQLYSLFFNTVHKFIFTGMGQEGMEKAIHAGGIDIDNYHLFFMNQIGVYGIFHTIAFNILLILIYYYVPRGYRKYSTFLMLAFWSNVMFQTYGYEFQNLWLFIGMASVKAYLEQPHLYENRKALFDS